MSVNTEALQDQSQPSLLSLFWIFIKIGCTAFGGFMALIAVVKNYLVDREKLLSDDEMLDGISLATILPGPVAVNVVAYAGYKIRGVSGAVVCATAVTLPSFFLILFLSYAYFTWGEIPAVSNIFMGILPAVAAIILATSIKMGQKSLTGFSEITIAVISMLVLIFIGGFYSSVLIILSAGFIGWLIFKYELTINTYQLKNARDNKNSSDVKTKSISGDISKKNIKFILLIAGLSVLAIYMILVNTQSVLAVKLFTTFSSMSLLLFGGGFVFIPLMQETVVETYHWVSHKEFVDAIAMGQITPGPILISATFIGYKVAGVFGAVLATIGIFTPPAMLMLLCTHYLQKVKDSLNIKAVLKGVRCAVIGMIAAAAYVVSLSAESSLVSVAIFLIAMFALVKLKLEVVWIIPISGVVGLIAYA